MNYKLTTCLAIAITLTTGAFSGPKPLICPVTKLSIASTKAAVGKSVYKGKTYYFCTSNCKRLFDLNPAKYAKHSK